ncbi:MAG: hypothetical protein ACR2MK_04465 [Solirubrobacteraceae bacterium]
MTLLAEIALVAIAAIGVATCLALLPAGPSLRRRRAAAPPPSRPVQLLELERLVSMSGANAVHVHAYLRPLLAEIAGRRLAARGRTLARMPESAGREVLGDRLWEIVRPGRPFPEDRHGPGVSPQDLRVMLEVLERL